MRTKRNCSKVILLCLFTIGFVGITAGRQLTQTIRGTVVDKATGQPLAGASVVLLPVDAGIGTSTDKNGRFLLKEVPVGRQAIQVSYTGYQTDVEAELLVVSGKESVVEMALEQAPYELEEVSVTARAEAPDLGRADHVEITAEQFQRIAANYLDPARVVLSSPSVANTNDQNNAISVRGNSPVANTWRLEGVEIVNPNHLANAGTISDRPTQNGGGVNVLSTQMLDKSSFLMGYMPAGYGNAIGGIFDMNLRKGNNQQREYTAQASLIGLDFAAEGPFKKGGSASYLINYRYSFTGLLALMGVDFGGETIKFQDLSFNVSLPETPIGKVTLFGVNGWNSNVFKGPDNPAEWEEEKDLSDIDYVSSIYAYGLTQEAALGTKSSWRNVLIYSSTDTDRKQATNGILYNADGTVFHNSAAESVSKLSFSSTVSSRWGGSLTSEAGLKGTSYLWGVSRGSSTTSGSGQANQLGYNFDVKGLLLQPFISGKFAANQAIDIDLGLNSSWFSYTNDFFLEPRANVDIKTGPAGMLSLSTGLYSQVLSPYAYRTVVQFPNPGAPPTTWDVSNTGLKFVKSWSSELSWRRSVSQSLNFSLTGFYQHLYDVPHLTFDLGGNQYYYSYMNYTGDTDLGALSSSGNGRTYGLSVEARQSIVNGFYIWTGGTVYRSEFQDPTGGFQPSRFDGRYNFNATLGKEFHKKKSALSEKIFGVNSRLFYQGGFRQQATPGLQTEYDVVLKDYMRLDLRIQWTRFREKYTRMFAVDIQNVLNIENPSYYYYDGYLRKDVLKTQLGMIPVIVYRIDF